MTQVHLLHDIATWLVNIVFWTSLTFPVVTRFYWNWSASPWGRNIVALEACIAATLLGSILAVDFGVTLLFFQWVSVVSLAMVAVIVIQRMVLIWRDQRTVTSAGNAAPVAAEPPAEH